MSTDIESHYNDYYKKRHAPQHIYPVEFVVRSFLGTYPKLKMDSQDFIGKRILDLGFGDGRNFPLLNNLGFQIHGVEITERILDLAKEKFKDHGFEMTLALGTNSKIPYETRFFDYVLGCHAIYYIAPGESFSDNLKEIARVMKPGATLVASLPMPSSYIVQNAKPLENGHVEIKQDPLGIRMGSTFRLFQNEEEIRSEFSQYFDHFTIGNCRDDFFGIQQDVFVVVCKRSAQSVSQ